jgi:hypothetical protein
MNKPLRWRVMNFYLTIKYSLKTKKMRKIILVLFLICMSLSLMAQEKKWFKEIGNKCTDKTIQYTNPSTGETRICDLWEFKLDKEGDGYAINKNTLESYPVHVKYGTEKNKPELTFIEESNNSGPSVPAAFNSSATWFLSCHCQCCGTGWSQRPPDQSTNCIPCVNRLWGGCRGEVQHPFYYFTCDCGFCTFFSNW